MPRSRSRAVLATVTVLGVVGASAAAVTAQKAPSDVRSVTATLRDAAGAEKGIVEFRQSPRSALFAIVSARGLPQGYHGFHVHAVGKCEGPGFMSATGHLKNAGESHGRHKGDFPTLYVKSDGTGALRFQVDRLGLDGIEDVDGSAVMVHANPDNFGNIPTERYDPDVDQTTQDTGDSGARIACGVIAPRG